MEPLIVWTLSQTAYCIDGLDIDARRCMQHLERITALATMLVAHVGYDTAAKYAKLAMARGIPFKDYTAGEYPDLLPLLDSSAN